MLFDREINMNYIFCIFSSFYEFFLAASAISAAIFAGLTWRQAKDLKRSEDEAKCALIYPGDEPGYLKWGDSAQEVALVLEFKNYGINPASKIKLLLSFYANFCSLKIGLNVPQMSFKLVCYNPIPRNGKYKIKIARNTFEQYGTNRASFSLSKFLIADLSYDDTKLNKNIEHRFYWHVSPEGMLAEVTAEQHLEVEDAFAKYRQHNQRV